MNEFTRILNQVEQGQASADRLLPLVYGELRKLAAARLAGEKPGQTLAATGLVHEAWLRLAGGDQQWDSRGHFFAAAAEAMRRILIDRARIRNAEKRGGELNRVEFDFEPAELNHPDERLLQFDEALTRFTLIEPEKARLVKLRYFAGCTIKEAAKLLGISTATADRHWVYAKAWLQAELSE